MALVPRRLPGDGDAGVELNSAKRVCLRSHRAERVSFIPNKTGEYRVRLVHRAADNQLVATIEFVSPSNKNRPEHRKEFVERCVSFLQQGVSVSIFDVVTDEQANLYLELLDYFGQSDPSFEARNANLYAVTCAGRIDRTRWSLKSWAYPLTLGEPLPTLPIILSDWLGVSLDLEPVYEETCQVLDMVETPTSRAPSGAG